MSSTVVNQNPDEKRCCERREGKYWLMLGLVGGFFLVELIVAVVSGSLALRTDAFHMATDFLALVVALVSLRMSRRGRTVDFTYGWLRMEVIGGLINSVILLTVCFTMVMEVIEKMIELHELGGDQAGLDLESIDLVLIVAGIGMLINILGLIVFCGEHVGHSHTHSHSGIDRVQGDASKSSDIESVGDSNRSVSLEAEIVKEREDFNHMAVMLHILGDALGSLVVLISGCVIKWGGSDGDSGGDWRYYLDPLGTVVIVIVIGVSSLKLLVRCVKVLIHQIPSGMDSEAIQRSLVEISGVVSVHEFHLWSLTSSIVIATCHLKIEESVDLSGRLEILDLVKGIFHSAGIHNSTVQLEFDDCEPDCGAHCARLRCCQE